VNVSSAPGQVTSDHVVSPVLASADVDSFDLPSLAMVDWGTSEASEWLDAFVDSLT
jgi:hypothetical protein